MFSLNDVSPKPAVYTSHAQCIYNWLFGSCVQFASSRPATHLIRLRNQTRNHKTPGSTSPYKSTTAACHPIANRLNSLNSCRWCEAATCRPGSAASRLSAWSASRSSSLCYISTTRTVSTGHKEGGDLRGVHRLNFLRVSSARQRGPAPFLSTPRGGVKAAQDHRVDVAQQSRGGLPGSRISR